ncbi:MAG TPA: hypothetical protein DD490_31960, partial [Acidobacteria bacterium]|nr:hypothetical protein [Acidobacteriota bacterium]
HGHGDGHHPGDGHHHGDGDAEAPGGFAGLIQSLGLGGVPVTLMLSVLILAGWGLCIAAVQVLGVGAAWVVVVAPLAALVVAVPVTAVLLRPLRRFFVTVAAPGHRDVLGKICTVTTLQVDERYGQAEVADGGAGLVLQVRTVAGARLHRGDRALIYDYKDEVFYVEPVNQALQRDLENLES